MAIAFTFDDGPGLSTKDLLGVLEKHACKAAFFVIGENLADPWWSQGSSSDPWEVAAEVVRAGHIVGNHTMTHNARLSMRDLCSEILACDELVERVYRDAGTVCPRPIPFRLPYGIRTFIAEQIENGVRKPAAALDNRLQALASLGRTHVHWTAILPDWQMKSSADVKPLVKNALDHIERMESEGLNAVFAFHDGRQRGAEDLSLSREFTVEAVDAILVEAGKRGWSATQVPVVI